MRHIRLLALAGAAALAACGDDDATAPSRPALAAVRVIHAMPDTGAFDLHAIDQIEWSPAALALGYRASTQYFPTEAGERKLRVFPTSREPGVTSAFLIDTTLTFEADKRYTLLVKGTARTNTEEILVIEDAPPIPATDAANVAVRGINAAAAPVDLHLVPTATTSLVGRTPTFGALAPYTAAAAYVTQAAAAAAVRAANPASTTALASAAAPNGTAAPAGSLYPTAGISQAGTAMSAVWFPAGVAGSPNAGVAAGLVWFVDQNPGPITTP